MLNFKNMATVSMLNNPSISSSHMPPPPTLCYIRPQGAGFACALPSRYPRDARLILRNTSTPTPSRLAARNRDNSGLLVINSHTEVTKSVMVVMLAKMAAIPVDAVSTLPSLPQNAAGVSRHSLPPCTR